MYYILTKTKGNRYEEIRTLEHYHSYNQIIKASLFIIKSSL